MGSSSLRALAVFTLAGVFVLKLIVLLQLRDHPLTSPDAGLDTTAYADLARRVVAGDVALGPGLYYVSPLYIYVLAAGLAVFDSFTAVRVVQIALGTASVWFIFLTAREWFGERAAWIARGTGGVHRRVHALRGPDPAGVDRCVPHVSGVVVFDRRLPPEGGSHSEGAREGGFRLQPEDLPGRNDLGASRR